MYLLLVGLVLFFGVHVISSTPLKLKLVMRLTEQKYKGIYALVSLVGFILIIAGKIQAPFHFIWSGLPELRGLSLPIMLVCFILLPPAHMKGNIKRFTRHPMLWAVSAWSAIHFLLNGDLAAMMLFGAFFVYSMFAMISQNSRGATKQQEKLPLKHDVIVVAAGSTVFVAILLLHGVLFGVPLL